MFFRGPTCCEEWCLGMCEEKERGKSFSWRNAIGQTPRRRCGDYVHWWEYLWKDYVTKLAVGCSGKPCGRLSPSEGWTLKLLRGRDLWDRLPRTLCDATPHYDKLTSLIRWRIRLSGEKSLCNKQG